MQTIFKRIYYLNLDERVDRNTSFIREMEKYNLKNIIRFPAIKRVKGYIGCALSHCEILKHHLNSEFSDEPCIVFEDDFVWVQDKETVQEILIHFFSSNTAWDVLIFSTSMPKIKTSNDVDVDIKGIKRIKSCQTTAAYMVNAHYVETLLNNFTMAAQKLEQGKSKFRYCIDQHWKKLQSKDNWFIASPGFGKQQQGFSDIEQKIVSYKYNGLSLVTMNIRPLEKGDWKNGYIDLLKQLTDVGQCNQESFEARFNQMEQHNIIQQTYIIIVAQHPQSLKIVGTATLLVEGKFIHNCGLTGHIEDVVVHRNARRQGVGLKLIETLKKMGEKLGCYKLHLDCSVENIPFYEKTGFKEKERQMVLYF